MAIWRKVWNTHSKVHSDVLPTSQFTTGRWLAQVRASRNLMLRDTKPKVICVPPRYVKRGQIHSDDDIMMKPMRIDIEHVLGRAVCSSASGNDVIIGFENGIGLLCMGEKRQIFHHKCTNLLGGITKLYEMHHNEYIGVTTTQLIVLISLHRSRNCVIRWRALDNFANESGTLISITRSANGNYIIVGFDNGRVRVLQNSRQNGVLYNLSMRESADLLCAGNRYLVAACHMQPIGLVIWDLSDGRALFRFDQTCVGWEQITTIAGLSLTNRDNVIVLWSGKDTIRYLDITSGTFTHTTWVRATFQPSLRKHWWCATDEAENRAPSTHVGAGRVATSNDFSRVVVASANIAFIVNLQTGWQCPLFGARRTLVRFSSDERSVVTADTNAFGGLRTWVSGRNSIGARPTLRVWDANTGECRSEFSLPSAATQLSVAANIVAVVAKNVGQVVVLRY